MPDSSSKQEPNAALSSGAIVWGVVALCIMIICMGWSIYDPPSGRPLGFWGFISLWPRESILFGIVVIGLIARACVQLAKHLRKQGSKS